jgi:hypothetical protein
MPHATVTRGVLNLPASSVEREASSTLLDATGRRVMQLRTGPNDLSALAPGVYFVRANGPDGSVAAGKVTVVR